MQNVVLFLWSQAIVLSMTLIPSLLPWWLLCKRYLYTLIRVSRHNIITCILLLCSCIFVSNKAFWSWSWRSCTGLLGNFAILPLAWQKDLFMFHIQNNDCRRRGGPVNHIINSQGIKPSFLKCLFCSTPRLKYLRHTVTSWHFLYHLPRIFRVSSNG